MTNEQLRFRFISVFLGLAIVLAFFVLRPFASSLIMAIVFAIIFHSFYQRILRWVGGVEWVASILTILFLIVFVIVPLSLLSFQIFKEAESLYLSLAGRLNNQSHFSYWLNFNQKITVLFPVLNNLTIDVDQYTKNLLVFLVQNLGTIFSNLAKILVNFFVFLAAFFFLLKDGFKLKQKIVDISPLGKDDDEAIIDKITLAINSVIKGSLFVAVLQGISCSIGFMIFDVPNPILWGSAAVIGALIPGIGTAIVLTPAIIYLYLFGQTINAIGLFFWGVLAVGLIDNLLGPKFISKKSGLHPFLVFLSVIGGLSFFGPIGFILGPVVVSLLLVLVDVYSRARTSVN